MQCPDCKARVPDGARFCDQCGQALSRLCPDCGAASAPTANFCAECGSQLVQQEREPKKKQPAARKQAAAPVAVQTAERRQITVLFCDLVGSTALAAGLDPEDYRQVIRAYHACCAGIVARHGGSVAQYLGDGVMARFGFPTAHEDDAARAVNCALEMVGAIATLDAPANRKLQARIGIATGVVVVGDPSSTEVGETPNLAARLQGLATAGSIVMAESTKALVGDLFQCRDLGMVEVKGYAAPIRAWQVDGPSGVQSRFEAFNTGSSAFVGREEELDLLYRRWGQIKQGQGRVVLLSGEPGIGKSRLVAAFEELIAAEPHTRLRFFFSPYHQTSPLYPVVSQLGRAAGFERSDDVAARQAKLDNLLEQTSTKPEDAALIADLLSLAAGDRYPQPKLSPQQRKNRTLAALVGQVQSLARRQPVLMVFEDVHWSDPSSRELLDLTIECIRDLPVLILVTYRPEFVPPWIGQSRVTVISLNRLDERDGAVLARSMAGDQGLADDVIDDIVARADGVPLFVEELTKSILETGGAARTPRTKAVATSVPDRLHGPLMARLDAVGAAKDVAQAGSAIGREFTYELLTAVSQLKPAQLRGNLAALTDAGLIIQRGTPPHATYQFKHALIQDAAYGTLLREPRQRLHARIADVLTKQFPEMALPEVLAQHYSRAGLPDAAIDYWHKAGERAIRTSAYAEAVKHITNGIDLLQKLPSTMTRMRQELEFQIALGGACIASKGYGASETGAAYARAYELSRLTEDASQLPMILAGRAVHYHVRADVHQEQLAANELLAFARGRRDAAGEMMAHRSLGDSLLHVGDLRGARAHLEEALGILGPQSPPIIVGEDVRTAALAFLSLCLALQGHVSAAEERAQEAITRACSLQDPRTVAFALAIRCRTKCLLLDHKGLVQDVDRLHALAIEHSLKHYQAAATNYRGWAMALEGRFAEVIALLQIGIEHAKAAGLQLHLPFHGAMLATAYQRTGRVEDGLTLIRNLLEMVERTDGRDFSNGSRARVVASGDRSRCPSDTDRRRHELRTPSRPCAPASETVHKGGRTLFERRTTVWARNGSGQFKAVPCPFYWPRRRALRSSSHDSQLQRLG